MIVAVQMQRRKKKYSAKANNALQIGQFSDWPGVLNGLNLTISKVHTRRIQTLTSPSTPSTSSSSIPSHQHRRAGFLQKRRSFWAIPTALLLDKSPRMSVRSLARARLQITALLGSGARWPHWSSRSNPLCRMLEFELIM